MTFETFFINNLIPFLGDYFLLITLIGTIVSGNLFVIFISTLSGQGIFPYWQVLIISLIGTFISDTIWFNLGKTKYIDNLVRKPHFLYNYYYIKKVLSTSTERNKFLVFLGSKFVYGTKILTLMYVGKRNLKRKDFIIYNFSSSAIWVISLVSIGWLAGKGFTKILESFNNLRTALTVFILLIALIYFIWFLISEVIVTRKR